MRLGKNQVGISNPIKYPKIFDNVKVFAAKSINGSSLCDASIDEINIDTEPPGTIKHEFKGNGVNIGGGNGGNDGGGSGGNGGGGNGVNSGGGSVGNGGDGNGGNGGGSGGNGGGGSGANGGGGSGGNGGGGSGGQSIGGEIYVYGPHGNPSR